MDFQTVLFIFSLGVLVHGNVLKQHFVLKSTVDDSNRTIDDNWWKSAIFYQIYPRSFKDSNGDGTGDLNGIISKLDHLQDMGVTAVWLSPIYPTPGVDQGYDISDYRDIDPLFGTLDDLNNLITKAHDLGIKIIMDFVPNHTSEDHEWFQKSKQNDPTYKDYYVWTGSAKEQVPNNWISVFGDSAWTWDDNRNQFYLHQFASAQPDLNYANPAVVQEMKDILAYWLALGIDGFRMDAVPFLFEDPDFTDEPLSGAVGVNKTQYGYLKHIYTTNLDNTYDMIYQFRKVLDDYNAITPNITYSRIMMTEAYTDMAEQAVKYYGNGTTNGAQFTFNFNLITEVSGDLTSAKLIRPISKWLSHLNTSYVSNWVLGNHDQHRLATRLGVDNIDAMNMLTAFLPGVQVTYMGEEIGMEDGLVLCSQGHDPQAVKDCTTFNQTSRDFERTPYQWDASANAGFSNISGTWLPVSDNYKTTNLLDQNVAGKKSHYNVYKNMSTFRKEFNAIKSDSVSLIQLSDDILEIIRRTDKAEYVYLFNSGKNSIPFNMFTDDVYYEVAVTSIISKNYSVGDHITNPVTLQAHECIILKSTKTSGANAIIATWIFSLLSVIVSALFY